MVHFIKPRKKKNTISISNYHSEFRTRPEPKDTIRMGSMVICAFLRALCVCTYIDHQPLADLWPNTLFQVVSSFSLNSSNMDRKLEEFLSSRNNLSSRIEFAPDFEISLLRSLVRLSPTLNMYSNMIGCIVLII